MKTPTELSSPVLLPVVPTPRILIEVPCVSVCDDWMLKLGEIEARLLISVTPWRSSCAGLTAVTASGMSCTSMTRNVAVTTIGWSSASSPCGTSCANAGNAIAPAQTLASRVSFALIRCLSCLTHPIFGWLRPYLDHRAPGFTTSIKRTVRTVGIRSVSATPDPRHGRRCCWQLWPICHHRRLHQRARLWHGRSLGPVRSVP